MSGTSSKVVLSALCAALLAIWTASWASLSALMALMRATSAVAVVMPASRATSSVIRRAAATSGWRESSTARVPRRTWPAATAARTWDAIAATSRLRASTPTGVVRGSGWDWSGCEWGLVCGGQLGLVCAWMIRSNSSTRSPTRLISPACAAAFLWASVALVLAPATAVLFRWAAADASSAACFAWAACMSDHFTSPRTTSCAERRPPMAASWSLTSCCKANTTEPTSA